MAIDTQTRRRSVHGYGIGTIAPVADGSIGMADREHMAWLYSGISAGTEPTGADSFVSDAYIYDSTGASGAIGSGAIGSGTTQNPDTIYDT